VAILGTLAAGGCFVVVNPVTPTERTLYLLENCGARFLVSTQAKLEELQRARGDDLPGVRRVITRNEHPSAGAFLFEHIVERSPAHRTPASASTDLAATMYTSGSTGRPKGVTLTHLNIDTVAESLEEYLDNSPRVMHTGDLYSADHLLCEGNPQNTGGGNPQSSEVYFRSANAYIGGNPMQVF
jgi:long-subunit acyl-CoA synthetase (AMP-forming)